jgi:hypothetical protein
MLVAIELITKHIARKLDERGFTLRSMLPRFAQCDIEIKDASQLPSNVYVMTATPQLRVCVFTCFVVDYILHVHTFIA